MSTVLFVGDVCNGTAQPAIQNLSRTWTAIYAADVDEVEQRLQLHPVNVLVVPNDRPEIPIAEIVRLARTHHLPVIAYGDDPPAAISQADVAGYVQRYEFAEVFANVLEEVLDAEAVRQLNRELTQQITARTLTMVVGNDKARAPAIVQILIGECDRMHAIREEDHFRVAIAIEEALVNAIVHGNLEVSSVLRESGDDSYEETIALRRTLPEYRDRMVTIDLSINRERIEIRITDEGPGFDVSSIPDPTDPDYLERPCGRGMLMMRSFMDQVQYNSRGNSVTLIKRAPQPNPCAPVIHDLAQACPG